MTTLPKILFITPIAFNRVTGGGITFSALFRNWPKECLATIHHDPEPTLDDVCNQYYVLGPSELDFAFPFNCLRKASASLKATSAVQSAGSRQSVSLKKRFLRGAKRSFLKTFGDNLPEKSVLTPELEKWIREYKPDVIYTILGSNGLMDLLEQVRVTFNLPVVVHIMDDWMSANHEKGLLAPFAHQKMTGHVQHFMDIAKRHLSITPSMSNAYEERYGYSFEAFQNIIDTQKWLPVARDKSVLNDPLDILYVGSIFENAQLHSLVRLCKVVGELADQGKQITLTISSPSGHTDKYRHELEVHSAIRIMDTIRDDDVFFNRIAEADVLLLPVNFDDESVRFIRYSMPTKVPAYLTVGTPILLYAPAGIAQVEYAREEGWGYVVDEEDSQKLKEALLKLCEDQMLRTKLSETAKNIAQRNHDAKTVRKRFQQVLVEAAHPSK